jgi:transcription antitermination protein NusB
MSTRHIARTIALQTLFEIDMKDEFASNPDIDAIITRNTDEFGEGIKDISFSHNIVSNALSRRITIDDIITRAAPDWPLEKIGIVDRNVLRIGLTELLFGDRTQVPPKVAIDEAIELAKAYAGDTSGKFVNGVLGAIYKEMGEPEKGQITKTRKDHIDSSKRELLAGAIVYAKNENVYHLALVHDVFGYWTLPKGKIEGDEDELSAARREISEEIGIEITILDKIGENEYIANKPEKGKVVKHVSYFIASADYSPLILEQKGGLDDAKWFPIDEIRGLRIYDDIKPLLEKAIDKLPKK